MASTEESDLTFPEVTASQELNVGVPEEFPVDPISSGVATSKEKAEARAKAEDEAEDSKRDLSSTLISALVVSGVVVAAIGVAFFITKKLRKS